MAVNANLVRDPQDARKLRCPHPVTKVREVHGVRYCAGCLNVPEIAERVIAVLRGLVRL